jgi:hypothetical protein
MLRTLSAAILRNWIRKLSSALYWPVYQTHRLDALRLIGVYVKADPAGFMRLPGRISEALEPFLTVREFLSKSGDQY